MMKKALSSIVILMFAVFVGDATHPGAAQQDDAELAQNAFGILVKHCDKCHGNNGSFKSFMHIARDKRDDLVNKQKKVETGKPDESRIFLRITSKDMPMPPKDQNDPLNKTEIETIRLWIEKGAPDWQTPTTTNRFISTEETLKLIERDLQSLSPSARPFARYLVLTHLHNAGASVAQLQAYRMALSKFINSLSWEKDIIAPVPIDPAKTILRIDIRDYRWDEKVWYTIQRAYPYGVQLPSPAYARLCQSTRCDLPFVRADWFLSKAALPPLYHDILGLPKTLNELAGMLHVNIKDNIENAPGKRVWRAGFTKSSVALHNRIVERHRTPYGALWISYDFASDAGKESILQHPLDFEQAGGEIIFNLPNGLQAYLIVNGKGNRLDEAPVNVVAKPESRAVVRNGLDCMSCHVKGMQDFSDRPADELRRAIEKAVNPPYDHERALAIYVEAAVINRLVQQDMARFVNAVEQSGNLIGDREPIEQLEKKFQEALDAAHAGAEVGLQKDDFLSKLRTSSRLLNAGLGVLLDGGTVSRDVWEKELFALVVREMDIGIPPEPLFIGRLEIVSNPPGATVFINGQQVRGKVTPFEIDLNLGAQSAPVRVEAKLGDMAAQKDVTVERDKTTRVDLVLKPVTPPCVYLADLPSLRGIAVSDDISIGRGGQRYEKSISVGAIGANPNRWDEWDISKLPPEFNYFEAEIFALGDSNFNPTQMISITFVLEADGKEIAKKVIPGKNVGVPVKFPMTDLRGAKKLTLRVMTLPDVRANLSSYLWWGRARICKRP